MRRALLPILVLLVAVGLTLPAFAQPTGFVETFDGDPNVPLPWRPANWDVSVTGNAIPHIIVPMEAHHGPACEGPPATHHISLIPQYVYLCRDHVMTAASAGYAAVYLTPNAMMDFSQGESVLRFNMSTFRSSERDWMDFVIMPFAENLQLNFAGESVPLNAVHVEMIAGPGQTRFRAQIVRNGSDQYSGRLPLREVAYESFLTVSAARRDTFELRLRRDRIQFCMPSGQPAVNRGAAFCWVDSPINPPLTWNQGVVQINQRAYNPTKDDPPCPLIGGGSGACEANTWHLDDVSINPARAFSMVRADRDSADANAPELVFPHASPESAFLRFTARASTASGRRIQFYDGATWQTASLQRGDDTGDENFHSYWHPIRAGVDRVGFRTENGSGFGVRDVAFWSLNAPGQQGTPVPTATPTPNPATAIPATATSVANTATAIAATSTAIALTGTPLPPTATAIAATATAIAATATSIAATATAVAPTPEPCYEAIIRGAAGLEVVRGAQVACP